MSQVYGRMKSAIRENSVNSTPGKIRETPPHSCYPRDYYSYEGKIHPLSAK